MPYNTYSDKAPENLTGLTASLIEKVPNNPWDPLATLISYPDKYAQFVTKTNDQMSGVVITAEPHALSRVDVPTGALYIQHKPKFNTSVVVSDGVVDHVDFEHGIVYFSTQPTADFTVSYIADPDKYFGEYLTVIQDLLHCIQWLLGAGPTLNEGIKNAEMFLDSYPAEISARLPNGIHMRAVDRDIEIRSTTDGGHPNGTKHTITIGNSEDEFHARVSKVKAYRDISPLTGELGTKAGDVWFLRNQISMGPEGTSLQTGVTTSMVTSFMATGDPFIEDTWVNKVHGDQVVFGNQYILGQQIILNVTKNIQVNVVEEELEVHGNVRLGDNTDDLVQVAGDLEVTGGIKMLGAGAKPLELDGSILFTNGQSKGVFEQNTVDGLDPSYIECIRRYIRPDFSHGYVNIGGYDPVFEGTQSYVTGLAIAMDTGIPSTIATPHPSGRFYTGRFNKGDWWLVVKTGAEKASRRTVQSYDNTTKEWILTRDLDSALAEGTEFAIYHPQVSTPKYLEIGAGLSVTVKASLVWPMVGWQDGRIKLRESDYQVSGLTANSTNFIFMTVKNGVNGIDEDEPTFFASLNALQSDMSILIGYAVTGPSTVTSVTHCSIGGRLDTDWTEVVASASGNQIQAGSSWAIPHISGSEFRRRHMRIQIWLAADSGGAPGAWKKAPMDSAGFYVSAMTNAQVTVNIPSSPYLGLSVPFWARAVIEADE